MTALKMHLVRPNDIERGMCGMRNGLTTSDFNKVTCLRCKDAFRGNRRWYEVVNERSEVDIDAITVNIRIRVLSDDAILLVMTQRADGVEEEQVYALTAKEALWFGEALILKSRLRTEKA